jgi:hypothetical protein
VFQVLYAVGLWHFFFFAGLVFLGPFYLKNLISAVVVTSYEVETMSINEEVGKCLLYDVVWCGMVWCGVVHGVMHGVV